MTRSLRYLTHLQLEQSALLLHLLGDFSSGDLRSDHSVLFGVLSLLLLDLCSEKHKKDDKAAPGVLS